MEIDGDGVGVPAKPRVITRRRFRGGGWRPVLRRQRKGRGGKNLNLWRATDLTPKLFEQPLCWLFSNVSASLWWPPF